MKVQKVEQRPEPGYPSCRQFSVLGAAVIGLSGMAMAAEPQVAIGGDIKVAPRVEPAKPAPAPAKPAAPSKPSAAKPVAPPVAIGGVMMVDPKSVPAPQPQPPPAK